MGNIVPTISSGVAGPLGVIHLPRLWSKLLLGATGKLPESYDSCGHGFDQMVIDGLGLQRDEVIAFVETKLPSYPEFEAWVKSKGTTLDAASIEKLNSAIRGYNHKDATRHAILSASGIPDEGNILDAVSLNNIDDWQELHTQVTSG